VSRRSNSDGVFVDTGYLRDHISNLRNERKIALELYNTVKDMKANCDPSTAYQYDLILRDINQLVSYFESMARSLSHIDDQATQLSFTISDLIEDDTENTRRTASNAIHL
jgi:hypothetical protein